MNDIKCDITLTCTTKSLDKEEKFWVAVSQYQSSCKVTTQEQVGDGMGTEICQRIRYHWKPDYVL